MIKIITVFVKVDFINLIFVVAIFVRIEIFYLKYFDIHF